MELNVKVSGTLIAILALLHLGAMLIAFYVVADPFLAVGVASLLGFSLVWQIMRAGGARSRRVRRLTLSADGAVSLFTDAADRPIREYQLSGSRVFARAVILDLVGEGCRLSRCLILPHDSLEPEDGRTLRSRTRALRGRTH